MKAKIPQRSSTHDALREIYSGGKGSTDLSHLDRKPRNRKRTIILVSAILLLVAAAVAVGGYFLFSREKKFSTATVQVAIEAPENSSSGDEVVWTVRVSNHGNVAINQTEVNVHTPDGFTFVSSQPAASNEFHNNWSIGNVNANAEKTVKIFGTILGDLGSTKTITASVHYQPANFSSDFVAEASAETTITTSVLDVTVNAPTSAATGQKATYDVTITNTGTSDVQRLRLSLEFPGGLSDITTDPKPSEASTEWDWDTLKPKGNVKVKISGTLKGTSGQLQELKARAGIVDSDGAFRIQRERSALVLLLEPTLNITVTPATGSSRTINPDQTPKVTLSYSNDSDSVFSDVTITFVYASKDSDGSTVSLVDPKVIIASKAPSSSSTSGKLQWSKAEMTDLERLVPGAHGTIDIGLPLTKKLRSTGSGKNLHLSVTGTIAAASIAGANAPYEKSSEALTISINTELRIAVEGRYYSDEGETLGHGPLPPEVGATTTYQISWFVTNTLNGVQNVLLTATLPDNVSFVSGSTDGGNAITFDETTRKVRWQIAKIDAGVGQTLPTLTGTFLVSITPTPNDLGKAMDLLSATTATGVDAFTTTALSTSGEAVTTDLKYDTQASGKGSVAPASVTNTNGTNSSP